MIPAPPDPKRPLRARFSCTGYSVRLPEAAAGSVPKCSRISASMRSVSKSPTARQPCGRDGRSHGRSRAALRGKCLQHVGQADRVPGRDTSSRRTARASGRPPYASRPLPAAPLLDDYAALAVDFGSLERDAAGNRSAHRARAPTPPRGRSGLEHVNRLIKARVGVDVWPEASADRFQIVDELTRLEVGRAVERHVLEQVREAALIIGLVYRTC